MNQIKTGCIAIAIALSIFSFNGANAKPAYPGDILGRSLDYPGLGPLGHVGIATGDNQGSKAWVVIEALKKQPVIQINDIFFFKAISPYWGSRYGIGDNSHGTSAVLIEANHQRWWCPTYTDSTAYTIGEGNPRTGQIYKCGVWRCDTMVAWSYFSAGYYQLMKGIIMLPRKIFYAFPYVNNESLFADYISDYNRPMILEPEHQFETLTPDELNTMPYEEFVRIADIPLNQETPTHIEAEWRFSNDENVNNIKRGIFIDRLAMSNEQDVIPRFLKMHAEIDVDELKTKIIQGLMIHYQNNTINAQKNHASLRKFYTDLMRKKLPTDNAAMIVRGYIDTHTANEILANISQIDMQCKGIEAHLLLGLKHNLALKSQALEQIYMPSMIAMLKKYNRSDLDDMFFGITKMGYKQLRDSNSIKQIKAYMDYTSSKYTLLNAANNRDPYLGVAKKSLEELRRDLYKSNFAY